MKILASTKDMSRQTWLEHRQKGLGGSDAGTIAGLNPWQSPIGLYLEKTGEIDSKEAGEAAYWGNVLEEVVAQEFKQRNQDFRVQRKNFMLQHDDHEWMLANIDRELFHAEKGKGVLEIKTGSIYAANEWTETTIPERYMLQVQHYLAVTGYSYAYIAILLGGQKYMQYMIDRDEDLIAALIEIEKEFWERVQTQNAPELDGSKASEDLIKRLYSDSKKDKAVRLEDKAAELARQRQEAEEEEKAAKLKKSEAENKLKHMLQDAEIGLIPDFGEVTWKTQESTRVDAKILKEQYPDIYKNCCKVSISRPFKLKPLKQA